MSTWYFGLVEACGIFATALVIGIGGWLVNRGDITIGTVIAAVLLLAQLFEPVQQLSQLYNTVQSSTAALNKLFGILDTEPDVVGGTGTLPPTGDRRGRRDRLHVSGDRHARAHRRVARRSATASGSRSSVRPAPASRRSPS